MALPDPDALVVAVVARGYSLAHDGVTHRAGDVALVPARVAGYWCARGWATSPDPAVETYLRRA